MALAGTDFAHHRRFVDAAETHRRMMQRVLNADIVEHAKPGQVYMAGDELWNRIPDFTYDAPRLGWALRQNVTSVLLMLAWFLVACGFALSGTRRATVD
jgi:ABC-2 type transport system permease protein